MAVAENAFPVESLLAAEQSALVVPEVCAVPADRVKRAGFSCAVARLAGQPQSLLGVVEAFLMVALIPVGPGEVHVGTGLADAVTK